MNILIADRLISLRKSRNLSQEELAAKLGVSRQAVSKWERAESAPDMDNLISLAKLYGISLDALLLSENSVCSEKTPAQLDYAAKDIKEMNDLNDMDYANGNGVNPNKTSDYKVLEESRAGESLPFENSKLLIWMAGCYPVIVTLAFLTLGFLFSLWHPGWMVFLTIPMFYSYYHMCRKK